MGVIHDLHWPKSRIFYQFRQVVSNAEITANLNEKNLATNSSWDFDANFDTSDPN